MCYTRSRLIAHKGHDAVSCKPELSWAGLARCALVAAAAIAAMAGTSAIARADTCGGGTLYSFPCGPDGQLATTYLQAQGQAAQQARQLASQVSDPAVVIVLGQAVNVANLYANDAQTLLQQAVVLQASDPAAARILTRAALVYSQASLAVTRLAEYLATATLRLEGKSPAADHAAPQARAAAANALLVAVQKAVAAELGQAKLYAAQASNLVKQSQALLRRRPSAKNRTKAAALVAQANTLSADAQQLADTAQKLVVDPAYIKTLVRALERNVQKLLPEYRNLVHQTQGLYRRVKSPAIRSSIHASLRQAALLAGVASRLMARASGEFNSHLDQALTDISTAYVDAGQARSLAAGARGVAATAAARHQ